MSEKRTILQQRMRVLNKLYNYGCKTEKDLQKLTLENILEINGITIPEMSVITELQKQVKAGTLYSYLGGGEMSKAIDGVTKNRKCVHLNLKDRWS